MGNRAIYCLADIIVGKIVEEFRKGNRPGCVDGDSNHEHLSHNELLWLEDWTNQKIRIAEDFERWLEQQNLAELCNGRRVINKRRIKLK